MFDKQMIIGYLTNGEVQLEFTKTDGSDRFMIATLREDLLVPYESKSGKTRKKNDEVQAVYDLEEDGWRSFRWDSLKGYTVL